jgi:hypothetical protein
MRLMEIADKELFLRYAVPCGQILVRRGSLDAGVLESLRKRTAEGRSVRDDVAECFPVAARMTTLLAQKMGREEIDEDVIRRYFLFDHDRAVRWRASLFPDVSVEECLISPGRISEIQRGGILVNTPRGELSLRKDFIPEARRGDLVAVHYDFVAEPLPRKDFDALLRRRLP